MRTTMFGGKKSNLILDDINGYDRKRSEMMATFGKGIEKSHTVKNFNLTHKLKYTDVHPGKFCQLLFEKPNQFAWSCCANFDKDSKVYNLN